MDTVWLIILIVLASVLVIGVFMVMECMESCFHKDRNCTSSPSSPYIIGNHFTALTDDIDLESGQKQVKANPIGGIFSHLHRGTQSLHAQGLCNHGGGAWGTAMSISGRAATTSNWSQVSGGPFDSCQCEDNGGFH